MASASGSPFDGFAAGTSQSAPPRRRAHEHRPNRAHSPADLEAGVPALRGKLRAPGRARRRREWATSPRRYRVWVGWRTASVSDNLLDLLALIDSQRTIPELARALGERQGRRVHPMEVAYLTRQRLAPAGLIRMREPQWSSAPARPSSHQSKSLAAPALPAALAALATGALPSPVRCDAEELLLIEDHDTMALNRQALVTPAVRPDIAVLAGAIPALMLPNDDAPAVVVPRLPDTPPLDDEVYVDEQPTMLLASPELPSIPAPASSMPNAGETAGARMLASRSTRARQLGRVDAVDTRTRPWQANLRERIGLVAARVGDERHRLARASRHTLGETQRAASMNLVGVRARRIGTRARVTGAGLAGVVLLGLALALAIASQQAHPSVTRHGASPTAVPPTPTPLHEPILPGETAYSVRQGDTLASIASAFHVSQGALLLVNGDILPDPQALAPGMRLAIPAIYQPALPASVQPRPLYYAVRGGDTLYQIGQRFELNWHVIADYNHVTDPRTLSVGQGLVIPPAGT